MKRLLIVDDEREVQHFFSYLLRTKDIELFFAANAAQVQAQLTTRTYDAALIDIRLPDINGLDILKTIKEQMPACRVVIMTGYSTVKSALEAIRLGADDYIEKPFDNIDELEALIVRLVTAKQSQQHSDALHLAAQTGFIVGHTPEMLHMLSLAYKIARKNVTVLIEGETGTGKEVLARFIHQASLRQPQPFIGVNCGALTETLLESELFGHEKGAFTGAFHTRKGLFEIASKGTLFLDEIGDASPSIQMKLLRVLETRELMRVGGEHYLHTDARIIAASHVQLAAAVQQGKFREDLLYRLDVIKLHIPPLRQRKADIPYLVGHLLKRHAPPGMTVSADAMAAMQQYDWPGNIRELSNVIMRAITLAEGETSTITAKHLPYTLIQHEGTLSACAPAPQEHASAALSFESYLNEWKNTLLSQWNADTNIDLPSIMSAVKDLEKGIGHAFIKKTLRETLGNRKEAARRLNISVRTLRYLLNEKEGTEIRFLS